jgi:hypothetical protein
LPFRRSYAFLTLSHFLKTPCLSALFTPKKPRVYRIILKHTRNTQKTPCLTHILNTQKTRYLSHFVAYPQKPHANGVISTKQPKNPVPIAFYRILTTYALKNYTKCQNVHFFKPPEN